MGVRRSGKSVILLQIIEELKARGIPESQIIYLNFEYEEYDFIKGKEGLLKEIFIVSDVEIHENRRNEDSEVAIGVKVERAEGEKCERCWMYSNTVGESAEYPTLCERCRDNLV